MCRRVRRLVSVWFAVSAMVIVVACAPSRSSPRVMELRVHHSTFMPGSFAVAPNSKVRIVVRNTDPIDHELIVGDQATQDRHEHGLDTHHGSMAGEVSVPAGLTSVTTYHFGPSGFVLFGCHLPGHWAYGMHGVISVAS